MSKSPKPTTPTGPKKLRIFLSYSSEQADLAEQVEMALTASGHDVFFDRTDLPPGGEYNSAIQERIRASDLLVFLISPESISKGRYTRTELRYAQDTWSNPIGRVLPVMAVETDIAAIPAYLKAGTILRPEGNLPAEVTAAVNDLVVGINPHETFEGRLKLIKETAEEASRLRRQQKAFEIEQRWREEKQKYHGEAKGVDISALGAKGSALIVGLFFCGFAIFNFVAFTGPFGGGFPIAIILVVGAISTLMVYFRGRKYEDAEADYRNRLNEALYDQDPDSTPMFSDFDELMRRGNK